MKKLLSVTFLCIMAYASAQAQFDAFHYNDDLSLTPDSTARRMSKVMKILSEFRFQSYIQVEWQRGDTSGKQSATPLGIDGVGSFQGGQFPAYANNRFLLRRSRFKLSFEHTNKRDLKILEFAFQLEAYNYNNLGAGAPGPLVKEFYGRLIDPWIGWFSFQGGIFSRPFGYETPSNPAFAESPEFARVNQTMLPNEAELGAGIIIESPAKFEKVYLRLDAFAVNGVGVGVASQTGAYMNRKDFIGRIKAGKMWNVNATTKLGLNGSLSYYNGGVLQTTSNVDVLQKNSAGQLVYTNISNAAGEFKNVYIREYYGAHLELKADYALGTTTLRGEFMSGVQPGTPNSSLAPTGTELSYPPPFLDLFIRRFMGGSALLTQSFKQKVKNHLIMHDITFKYDVYNPQTQLKGYQLNIQNPFAITDIKYTTLGFGYSITPYNWFKLMIWYDWVMNENTNIPGYLTDYKKQNVLTIRTQFYIDSWWFNAKSKYKDNLMQKKY
jgi:hypothetical protein